MSSLYYSDYVSKFLIKLAVFILKPVSLIIFYYSFIISSTYFKYFIISSISFYYYASFSNNVLLSYS